MKKLKRLSIKIFFGLLLSTTLITGCQPEGSEQKKEPVSFKQRINSAKAGETIDLGKEDITIADGDSYTVDKTLTIVNGDAKNATFTVTADGVLFKNIANVERIIAGEELGEGDLAIRNCFEIDYLHVNGGGKNSIHIASTEINELKVSKKDVRIVLETDEEGESTAKVNTAIIEEDCKLEGADGLSFGTVQVEDPEVKIDTEKADISDYKLKLAEGMFVNTQNCDCGVETKCEVLEDNAAKVWIDKNHTGEYTEWHSQLSMNYDFTAEGSYKISFVAKADSALNTKVDLWCQNKEVTTCSIPLDLTTEYKTFTYVIPVHKDLVGTSNFNINLSTTPIYLKDLKIDKEEAATWELYQSDEIFNVKEDDLTSIGHMAILESTETSIKVYRNARAMKTPTADSQYLIYKPNITTAGEYKFVFTDESYIDDDGNKNKTIFDTLLVRYKDGTEKETYKGFTDSKGTYYATIKVSEEDLSKGLEIVFQSSLNWQWITQYFILKDVAVKPASETVEGKELTSGSNTDDSKDDSNTEDSTEDSNDDNSDVNASPVWAWHDTSKCTCGGTFSYEELSTNEYKISTTGDHTSAVWNSQFGIDNQIITPGKYRVTFEAKAEKETKSTVEVWSGTTQRTFASSSIDLDTTYNTYSMLVYIGEPVVGQIRTKIDIVNGTYYLKNVKIEENNTNWSAWMDNSLYTPEADDQWNLPNLALVLGDEVDGEISTVAAVTKNGNWTNVDGWKRNFSYQMPAFAAGDYVATFTKDEEIDEIYVRSNTSGTDIIATMMNRKAGDYYLKFTIPEELSGEDFELGFPLRGSSQWSYDMFVIENFSLKKASEVDVDNLPGREIVENYTNYEEKKITDNLSIVYECISKNVLTSVEEISNGFSFEANRKFGYDSWSWDGLLEFYYGSYDFSEAGIYEISFNIIGPGGKVLVGSTSNISGIPIEADKENKVKILIDDYTLGFGNSLSFRFCDNEIGKYTISDIKVEKTKYNDVCQFSFSSVDGSSLPNEEWEKYYNKKILTFSEKDEKKRISDYNDISEWQEILIEYESEIPTVQLLIAISDDFAIVDEKKFEGNNGIISVKLDADYKPNIALLELQASDPGEVKIKKAYLLK